MLTKLDNIIREQLSRLCVTQDGEPKDGPILLTNCYGLTDVDRRLVYYIVCEYSQKSINKFTMRDVAYNIKGNKESHGVAVVLLEINDPECLVREVQRLLEIVSVDKYTGRI